MHCLRQYIYRRQMTHVYVSVILPPRIHRLRHAQATHPAPKHNTDQPSTYRCSVFPPLQARSYSVQHACHSGDGRLNGEVPHAMILQQTARKRSSGPTISFTDLPRAPPMAYEYTYVQTCRHLEPRASPSIFLSCGHYFQYEFPC